MKRLLLVITMLMLFTMGCDTQTEEDKGMDTKENTQETVDVVEETSDDSVAQKEYVLTFREVTLTMHGEMLPVLEALGEPDFYFEAESCAFQGMDKTYTYGGIEIHTYESQGKDYIASILFLDDTLETDEGVVLFDSFEAVVEAYGEGYIEGFGLYTYEGMDSKINFLIEDDELTSIELVAMNIEDRQK